MCWMTLFPAGLIHSIQMVVLYSIFVTSSELQRDDTADFEIVHPVLSDISGNTVSHAQLHGNRFKRDSSRTNTLFLNITGQGQAFEIHLNENRNLLAPGFKVYHRKRSKDSAEVVDTVESSSGSSYHQSTTCHYSGKERSQGGRAALSLCDGLNGIIRIAEEDYIIEPYKQHRVRPSFDPLSGPHKLYRRSTLNTKQTQFCGKAKRLRDKRSTSLVETDNDFKVSEETLTQTETKKSSKEEEEEEEPLWKKYQRAITEHEEWTVETLVVVDKIMYYKHGKDNITTFTLTLFNMVSELFTDPSLGDNLNIVLVGLIVLEGDEPGLSIGYHADNTLNSFCSWQSVLVGANGRQHDHAILLTGLDLCSYKNAPCDTLGFAPIEGMCNRIRSCTINEDTGLSTAFTIAHEMGHNFGMFHDGEGNHCTKTTGTLMSPTLVSKEGQFHWSLCSKTYLMKFMNTPQAQCLADRPTKVAELQFPNKLPGELYDADIQCKWQFGRHAQLCTYDFGKDICKSLWCFRGKKRCETKFLPAAEGTSCGYGKWCRSGECVEFGQNGPSPIDGSWSTWTHWTDCSRTCGGGVTTRERQCNKPLPQYGGNACEGEAKVRKMCNFEPCAEGEQDFHKKQCHSYNEKPFRGWLLDWRPNDKLYKAQEPCILYCLAETSSYVFTIKHTATDGMKCRGDRDICVDGTCQPIGCDMMVGSTAENDQCGVCKGDNSTCRIIQGEYTEQPNHDTYFPIALIPKTATSIKISEKNLSSNYLAIRDIYGNYYLNGQQQVAWPGEYMLGGAQFTYNRPYNEPETLESMGPLKEDLVLEILVQDKNPGIQYKYAIPHQVSPFRSYTPPDNYTWSRSESACTEPCAGGTMNVTVRCLKNLKEEVNETQCDLSKKPQTGKLPCNEDACPPRWVPAEWNSCSKTCGRGKQRRKILCHQRISKTLDKKIKKSNCKSLPKPARTRRCNLKECPPVWRAGKWNKCSVSCGTGTQARKVFCKSKGKKGKKHPDEMCSGPKPSIVRPCKRSLCPQDSNFEWHLSPWGPCSHTCGPGVRQRYLVCKRVDYRGNTIATRDKYCEKSTRPKVSTEESCKLMVCPHKVIDKPKWKVSPWSQCSASCGEGQKSRDITCVDDTGQRTLGCDLENRPATSQLCDNGACPTNSSATDCFDRYTWCHLVPQHKVCDHEFYGTHCCLSCKGHR